mmetsp:Transcript_9249/g.20666  ORF Transcript_9249/g.20666 Transcript_9249/m.20666 type:complete len:356 (+) Transcript_9249:49-1116(+)
MATDERQPLLSERSVDGGEAEDLEQHPLDDAEETTYTASMLLIIRDMQRLAKGSKHKFVRSTRIACALGLIWILIGIQVFLLIEIKIFVTSPSVGAIREVYDAYQKIMYDSHVRDSGFGFSLGIGGPKGPYFNEANFKHIPKDQADVVCSIPFSQPEYLGVILLIWSLTVIGEVKTCCRYLRWLWSVDSVPLSNVLAHADREGGENDFNDVSVIGLPKWLKIFLASGMVLPRLLVAVLLGWLGCRWLASTLSFAECLINAVALEFVIALNTLLYDMLMSDRNKRELNNMKMSIEYEGVQEPSALAYLGTFAWGFIALSWVVLYIFRLQMVLPGYQWDVKGPCAVANGSKYSFWRI